MNRSFKKYTDLLQRFQSDLGSEPSVITESEVRGLLRLFRNKPKDVLWDKWHDLYESFNEVADRTAIRITPEHTEKGLEWISKSIGMIRRAAKKGGVYSEEIFEAMAKRDPSFAYFAFAGFFDGSSSFNQLNYPDTKAVLPMWRIVLKSNSQVTYTYASWQDGRFFTGVLHY